MNAEFTFDALQVLFRNIWETEKIPEELKEGSCTDQILRFISHLSGNNCWRQIHKIWWLEKIINTELCERNDPISVIWTIKYVRGGGLDTYCDGHSESNITKQALDLNLKKQKAREKWTIDKTPRGKPLTLNWEHASWHGTEIRQGKGQVEEWNMEALWRYWLKHISKYIQFF